MHRYLQVFIDTISHPGIYLSLLATFALLFVWMMVPALPFSAADFTVQTNDGSPLDMMIGYSPEKAYELMDGYGTDGRVYYIKKLLINDTVFPIVYSLMFAATLALLLKRLTGTSNRVMYLAFLPLAGGILDLMENAGIISMLLYYPARADWVATTTGLITSVKLGVNITVMLLIVAGLAVALYKVLKGRAGRAGTAR